MDKSTENYLPRLDREPDASKLRLAREFMAEDPLGFFKELRENRPVLETPGCTLVALYDDVIEVLNLSEVFTAELYVPKMSSGYLMAHDDDALHFREKAIMRGLLNRDDLPRIRRLVATTARNILANAGGKMDAVQDYCRVVPATLVQEYFGLSGMDRKKLIEWSYWAQVDTFYNQPFDLIPEEKSRQIVEAHNAAAAELAKYITKLMVLRTLSLWLQAPLAPLRAAWRFILRLLNMSPAESHDNIVTRMLRTAFPDEVDFNITRAGTNAGGLLIGAIETTSQATAQAIQYLLQTPEILSAAREAARQEDTAGFDAYVWEVLRYVPISPYMFRKAASDYTLAKGTPRETVIKKGTLVLTLTQSAMFDVKAFKDPDTFRAGREWQHNFTFGYGLHECLGKYIGMVMIPEMVRQMLLLPGLAAQGNIQYDGHLPQSYPLAWSQA